MAKAIALKALREREAAQVPPRLGLRIVAGFVVLQLLLLAVLMILFPAKAGAAPVKGDVSVNTAGGYARMVFTLAEETEAEVRLANGILVITFKQPVGARDHVRAGKILVPVVRPVFQAQLPAGPVLML